MQLMRDGKIMYFSKSEQHRLIEEIVIKIKGGD